MFTQTGRNDQSIHGFGTTSTVFFPGLSALPIDWSPVGKTGARRQEACKRGLSELQPFLWPRKFVQAGNSLKKKASVYNPTTSKRPRVRHLSRKVFSWSFRICDISGREANASSISRIRDLSCCALSQWGIFASRIFRIVDFSYPGFVIRPPVVSGSFRRGVFRRGVVSNAYTVCFCLHHVCLFSLCICLQCLFLFTPCVFIFTVYLFSVCFCLHHVCLFSLCICLQCLFLFTPCVIIYSVFVYSVCFCLHHVCVFIFLDSFTTLWLSSFWWKLPQRWRPISCRPRWERR